MYFNITEKKKGKSKQRSPLLTWIKWILLVYIGIVLLVSVWNIRDISQAVRSGLRLESYARELQHVVVNRDFVKAQELAIEIDIQMNSLDDALSHMKGYNLIPLIRSYKLAGDAFAEAGVMGTQSLIEGLNFADELFSKLPNESITYATLSNKQRGEFVELFKRELPLFQKINDRVQDSNELIAEIPTRWMIPPVKGKVQSIQRMAQRGSELLEKGMPMIEIAPYLVGHNEPQHYLFLLQNNTELRPTGGFIGTFGILTLHNGEIVDFQTDNIYNLDLFVRDYLQIPAPEPIQQYVGQEFVYLRDSNWNPDFPTTAESALNIYDLQKEIIEDVDIKDLIGDKVELEEITPLIIDEEFDGVIAVTPELLEDLLNITGPIVVGGIRFTAEDVIEELEFYVGRGYKNLGISDAGRKGILGAFADELQLRLTSVPYHQLVGLIDIFDHAFSSKALMMYSRDEDIAEKLDEINWDGRMTTDSDTDYLYVVDSNLASLKTDPAIDRSVEYFVTEEDERLRSRVELTYTHTGHFDWKTTRLRNYVRVYVPQGSRLISSQGLFENDKVLDPDRTAAPADIYMENDSMVFGGFVSVEPQETATVVFEYYLPEELYRKTMKEKVYTLCVQKQPGVIERELTTRLDLGNNVITASTEYIDPRLFETDYEFMPITLDADYTLEITF